MRPRLTHRFGSVGKDRVELRLPLPAAAPADPDGGAAAALRGALVEHHIPVRGPCHTNAHAR